MKQEWELRNAFPEMPRDCRDALLRAARSVEEGKPMKKLTLRTALIAALIVIVTMTAALAVTGLMGWTDFYSEYHSFDIPQTAKELLGATEPKEYRVGPVTFTVNELMTDGHIALCSATARATEGDAVISQEIYDAIGANGKNGRALADKWGLSPDTCWIDAAHLLERPFYRVSVDVKVPEEMWEGVDMFDAMWDENGHCASYYMASLNSEKVGDTLPVQLRFLVTEFDAAIAEPPSANFQTEEYKEVKEINRWSENYEVTLAVPSPIAEKTYVPAAPFDFESGLTLESVTAEQTVAGAYVVGRFTLREGYDFRDAYNGEIQFLDEKGREIEWGMAESGIIRYDDLPHVEWGAMLNMESLPDELSVRIGDAAVHVQMEKK